MCIHVQCGHTKVVRITCEYWLEKSVELHFLTQAHYHGTASKSYQCDCDPAVSLQQMWNTSICSLILTSGMTPPLHFSQSNVFLRMPTKTAPHYLIQTWKRQTEEKKTIRSNVIISSISGRLFIKKDVLRCTVIRGIFVTFCDSPMTSSHAFLLWHCCNTYLISL